MFSIDDLKIYISFQNVNCVIGLYTVLYTYIYLEFSSTMISRFPQDIKHDLKFGLNIL